MRESDQTATRVDREIKALRHGLQILDLLVSSDRPLSATAIGAQIGLHQTSVSRIIRTLITEGFVRKAGTRGFLPDFGVFALGAAAVEDFHLVDTAAPAMCDIAAEIPKFETVLVTMWHGQLLHFVRTQQGQAITPFSSRGFPLHLSSAGLRILIDLPRPKAIELLEASRDRRGWARPTELVPRTPEEALDVAQGLLERGTLITTGWVHDWHISGSIDVEIPDYPPFVLAIYGAAADTTEDSLRLSLHESRRRLEKEFNS